jgi:hypothetical protein
LISKINTVLQLLLLGWIFLLKIIHSSADTSFNAPIDLEAGVLFRIQWGLLVSVGSTTVLSGLLYIVFAARNIWGYTQAKRMTKGRSLS